VFRILISLFLLIININNLFSEGFKIKYYGNYFWGISNSKAKIYLLGSIHMANEKFYPLPEIIENAFNESDSLAVEFNVNNVDYFQMINLGMMQNQTLKDVLNDTTYNLLKKKFEEFNLPITLFNNLKPWLAAMLVSNMELVSDSVNPELGFDLHFLNKAKNKKGIIELESLKEQMNIFDNDLKEYQNEFVNFSLKEGSSNKDIIDKYFELWSTGDIKGLEKIVFDGFDSPMYKPLKEALYTKRNYNMADKISKFLNTDKIYFVVVGAAHLVGENGIIEILKNKYNN